MTTKKDTTNCFVETMTVAVAAVNETTKKVDAEELCKEQTNMSERHANRDIHLVNIKLNNKLL